MIEEYDTHFELWDKKKLLDFMKFVKFNFATNLDHLLDCYDEWMRGN